MSERLGARNSDLHYVRDEERREVDFLITKRRKPFWLVEAKLGADGPDPSLAYFRSRLGAERAIQVVRSGPPRRSREATVVPAERFLAWM